MLKSMYCTLHTGFPSLQALYSSYALPYLAFAKTASRLNI